MSKDKLSNLKEAIEIFLKYDDPEYPTHCEHDVMYMNIDVNVVSDEDKIKLDELGFFPDTECGEGFKSFRFGSA